jgi:hypothetical protein
LTTYRHFGVALDKKRLTPFPLDEDGEGLRNDRAPAQLDRVRQSPRKKKRQIVGIWPIDR